MPRIGRRFTPGLHRAAWGFMQSGDFPVPIGYWKFGENTGNALKDSSPEGNDGVNHGATWVKGWLGPGLSFDGLDDYASVAHAAVLNPSAFTVITRINMIAIPTARKWIIAKYASLKGWYLDITSGAIIKVALHNGTGTKAFTIGTMLAGEPHSIAFTYDAVSDEIKTYLDGVVVTEATYADYDPDAQIPLVFARASHAAAGYGNVIIDETIIFDEVLTARRMREWNLGIR